MKKIFSILFVCYCIGLSCTVSAAPPEDENGASVTATAQEIDEMALLSLLDLQISIKNRIKDREKQLKQEKSPLAQERIKEEIANLDKNLSETTADFERLATGIDPATFSEKRKDTFSWQEELTSLLKPAIRELKNLTINARARTTLQADIARLKELEPIAEVALQKLELQVASTGNSTLKKDLKRLLPEWKNLNDELRSKLSVLESQLSSLEAEDQPFIDDFQKSTGHFFKNRGLYLAQALIVFFLTLLCFSLVYRLVQKFIPAFRKQHRSFIIRLFDIFYRIVSVVAACLSLFVVFYLVKDWTLLSLLVVFFIAVLWTFRIVLPKFYIQVKLLLNIGSVREGERIMLYGVPWRINNINIFTTLENPDLNIQLRLPIEKLTDHCSRPPAAEENWFPCRKDDWVLLSDASFGKAISISHEAVTLLERGGARKTYQTADFLGLAPKNLSMNFRIKEFFGLSYDVQGQLGEVVRILYGYIEKRVEGEEFSDKVLDIQVVLNQAGGSSLDLAVIVDFKGSAAPLYNRLRRTIQGYCVDACSEYGWEIPFPQLVVHKNQISS
ncbi:MAG: hypothetical protein ACI8PB_000255 [Desulforhopalus sp.]|jgi:hypothetical protein